MKILARTRVCVLLVSMLGAAGTVWAQAPVVASEQHRFRVVTLVRGLDHPWSMAFLPDGRMLVTEREGRMRVISPDFKLQTQAIEGLPEVAARGQGGLFDVALHPD